MTNRIAITGIGAVSAAGEDVAATVRSFRAGRRNIATSLPFDSTIDCPTFQIAAPLPELPGRYNNSRTLRLAMKAINEAWADAGLPPYASSSPSPRVAVCLGTTVACQLNSVPFYDAYRREKRAPLDPVLDFLHANLGQAVATLVGAAGPRMTIVNACSSGADAIGVAASWIRAGLCDVAIAGGADELNRVPLAGFWSLGVMSASPCAPFDRDRGGLNLGEGAGVVILESAEHAVRRGRTIAFELAGFGAASDAYHLTAPHPEGRGLDAAVRTALAQAGVTAADVAFINAHGTATQDNDKAEGTVIARLFGRATPFLSTKGFTGHTLGAAGGLEAVFAILGLREGFIPASPGFAAAAEDTAVAPVSQVTAIDGQYALSTSLAFGGNNAAVLVRKVGVPPPVGQTFLSVSPPGISAEDGGRTGGEAGRNACPTAEALPTLSILGIGAVTPLGRTLPDITAALARPANADPAPRRVPDELLADPLIARRMRRADRYSRMATVAAVDAWHAAAAHCANVPPERVGLIVTTGFGPHGRGFKFLDGILDHGDDAAGPTDFSHSVHGAAAAYVTELLGLRGPSLNNTAFTDGFHHALEIAQSWLAEGVCDRVLVGAAEELGEVMEYAARQLLPNPERLGEGALFLTLGPANVPGTTQLGLTRTSAAVGDSSPRSPSRFAPHFGLSASTDAFDLLGSLLTTSPAVDSPAPVRPSCALRVTIRFNQQGTAGQ